MLDDLPVVIDKVFPTCGLTTRVVLQQPPPNLPANCVLHQKQSCTTVPEIDVAFQHFWAPFWSRDQDASEQQWKEAEEIILHKAPHLPAVSLPWHDLDAWELTIARTNAKSAPGTCGWRYSELKLLPRPAIQHLARLFQQVIELAGFTANFMTARTVLLAKVEQPQHIGHGRPITILSSLVRLFSKFAADRILALRASHLPMHVSGGLPHRGARLLAWRQQFELEVSLQSGKHCGGLSLDLVKCYNTLPRSPLGVLMVQMGCPEAVVQAWLGGLSHMCRFLEIDHCIGSATPSWTGVPEGDSLAVTSMVALGALFHSVMESIPVVASTYVDNFNFCSPSQAKLAEAVDVLEVFTEAWSLTISWDKTWMWGTNKAISDFWKALAALQHHYPDGVPVTQSAVEVGVVRLYSKRPSPGALHVQKGINLCRKIQRQHFKLRDAASVVQRGVFPLALYGADTQYLCARELQRLRSAIKSVIIGPWRNASGLLTCHVLTKQVFDPFVFILLNIFSLVRSAVDVDASIASQFSRIVCETDKDCSRCYGPASACAMHLQKVGWHLDDEGNLHGPPGTTAILIFTTSRRELKTAFLQWWDVYVWQHQQHRRGVPVMPWSRELTLTILEPLNDRDLAFAAPRIVSAFLSSQAKQNAGYLDAEATCPFCGEPETTSHVLVHCPAFLPLREEHARAVTILACERPEWQQVPVIAPSSGVRCLRMLVESLPIDLQFDIPCVEGERLVFFTDGSCINAKVPFAQRASWAVVQSKLSDDQAIAGAVLGSHGTSTFTDNFVCAACGLTPGRQTIDRSELAAICSIVLSVAISAVDLPVHVVSDSKYALHALSLVSEWFENGIGPLRKMQNQDLLWILMRHSRPGNITWEKVKSHQHVNDAKLSLVDHR